MSDAIDRLFIAVLAARSLDAADSRTAKLFREGRSKMAKKVVEEAIEVALDAVAGERQRVVEETADLLFNVAVLWAELGISPDTVRLLEALGHRVELKDAMGSAQSILVEAGRLHGAADPRRPDALALGF